MDALDTLNTVCLCTRGHRLRCELRDFPYEDHVEDAAQLVAIAKRLKRIKSIAGFAHDFQWPKDNRYSTMELNDRHGLLCESACSYLRCDCDLMPRILTDNLARFLFEDPETVQACRTGETKFILSGAVRAVPGRFDKDRVALKAWTIPEDFLPPLGGSGEEDYYDWRSPPIQDVVEFERVVFAKPSAGS